MERHVHEDLQLFENKEKAAHFISQLKEKYPRHIRDQLRVIEEVAALHGEFIEEALNEYLTLGLTSAVEFRDVAKEINRRRVEIGIPSPEQSSLPDKVPTNNRFRTTV